MDPIVMDDDGQPLNEGDRVRMAGNWQKLWTREQAFGVIIRITDPDGDVDSEGRSYGIPPQITVRFEDCTEDTFSLHARGGYMGDPDFRCEDLVRYDPDKVREELRHEYSGRL